MSTPSRARTVARLLLAPGAAGKGIPITRGQWEIIEGLRALGFCGNTPEKVLAHLLQTAIADRVPLVEGRRG